MGVMALRFGQHTFIDHPDQFAQTFASVVFLNLISQLAQPGLHSAPPLDFVPDLYKKAVEEGRCLQQHFFSLHCT